MQQQYLWRRQSRKNYRYNCRRHFSTLVLFHTTDADATLESFVNENFKRALNRVATVPLRGFLHVPTEVFGLPPNVSKTGFFGLILNWDGIDQQSFTSILARLVSCIIVKSFQLTAQWATYYLPTTRTTLYSFAVLVECKVRHSHKTCFRLLRSVDVALSLRTGMNWTGNYTYMYNIGECLLSIAVLL